MGDCGWRLPWAGGAQPGPAGCVPGWYGGRGGAPARPGGAWDPWGPCGQELSGAPPDSGVRASRGMSSRPPGEYTVVGLSTCSRSRRGRAAASRSGRPAVPAGAPTRTRSWSCSPETAARRWWPAWPRDFAACAERRLDDLYLLPLRRAHTRRMTRPAAMRPRPTGRPRVAMRPLGCLLPRRLVMLAPRLNAPSKTSTAPATAPGRTSRALRVAESERTAQRSHRAHRPASHMSRSARHFWPRGDTLRA
jgi:hypothetical protein